MFNTISPEKAGISSRKIMEFIMAAEDYGMNLHSLIMARGNDILAEAYFSPINASFLHRMYSVSKSFVAVAVGLAEQEGLLSLDDPVIKYFPEYAEYPADPRLETATIRDMLTMRTPMARIPIWWGKHDRVRAYFETEPNQHPGTSFYYDSAGCFMAGCIVERVTGRPFLEYMKDKVLLEIGFSARSYCLKAPGGHSLSDSGVMCTTMDLLIFTRFVSNGGVWNGKRYINEEFMRAAVSKQADNFTGAPAPLTDNCGYGYYIWKTPRDGFAFVGMADQLAVYDKDTDFIFIMTAENMGCESSTRALIADWLYRNIIPSPGEPTEADETSEKELRRFLTTRTLICQKGLDRSSMTDKINNRKYSADSNPLGIEDIYFDLHEDLGVLICNTSQGDMKIEFGFNKNRKISFPSNRRIGLVASFYEEGSYDCYASAAWVDDRTLSIAARVTDTYMGTLFITAAFLEDKLTLTFYPRSQRLFDNMEGTITATAR